MVAIEEKGYPEENVASTPGTPSESNHVLHLEDLPNGYYRSINFIASIAGVCLMAISLYLGFVLPANSLTIINEDIGPDPNYILISTSYTLVSGVGLLLVGRLGDVLGRRYFLIGGQTIGFIGAIVCGRAQNIPTLIGGSVLTGFAAANQLTFTFVLAELVPNKFRPIVNSGIFISTLPFAAFGPLIAELFVKNTSQGWRWNYYLNCITCGLSALLFVFFYFPPGYSQLHRNTSRWEQVKKLDYVGFVLYAGGLVLVLLGLLWGGNSYVWKSSHVIATLVVGFASLVAFVLYEIYGRPVQPLLPSKLLKNKNYMAITVAACVGTMIYFSMNVLWPQEIAILFPSDAVEKGWLASVSGCGVILGEILAGVFMKPIGHARWQLFAVTVFMTTFLGAMASVNQDRRSSGIAFIFLGGLGVGFQELIAIIMAALVCDPQDIGLASGLLGSLKQVSGTIATAIYVAILQSRITQEIPKVPAAAVSAGLPESDVPGLLAAIAEGTTAALEAVPGMTAKIAAAVGSAEQTAYANSFRTVYLASIAFGGVAIIAAFLTRSINDRMTSEVARKLRHVDSDRDLTDKHEHATATTASKA